MTTAGYLANLRRLYNHGINGGSYSPRDDLYFGQPCTPEKLSEQIKALEAKLFHGSTGE